MPCRATQDGLVIVESSDKTWFTGEGNGKPLQYSYLENPMNSMKKKKDMASEDGPPPRSKSIQYATGEELRNSSRSFGHLMRRADSVEKTLMLGKLEGKRRG